MKSTDFELHIEELVLDGLEGVHHTDLGATIERELGRLFYENRDLTKLEHYHEAGSIDGGTLESPSNATAATVGVSVAQNIYAGMKR